MSRDVYDYMGDAAQADLDGDSERALLLATLAVAAAVMALVEQRDEERER